MQAWLECVLKIRLKESGKPITKQQLEDWFFTCGSTIDALFENKTEAAVYKDFVNIVKYNGDISAH